MAPRISMFSRPKKQSSMRVHPMFASRQHGALAYRPPLWYRMVRSGLVVLLLGFLALFIYGLYWFLMAVNFRAEARDWLLADHADMAIEIGRLEVGGFPLALRLDLASLDLSTTDGLGRVWGWRGRDLEISATPWSPDNIQLTAGRRQSWTLGGNDRVFDGQVDDLNIAIAFDDNRIESFKMEVGNARLTRPSDPRALELGRIDVVYRDLDASAQATHQTRTADLNLTALGLRLPPSFGLPLGPGVARLDVQAGLFGPLSISPGGIGLGNPFDGLGWPAALETWRDLGGTVELERFGLDHGPLSVRAAGTLALDENLQPTGAFTARLEGLFASLTPLREAGWIEPKSAVTALVVLGAMVSRPDDAPTYLSVPLSVQGQQMTLGPVGLLGLPTVQWPLLAEPD
ncbi:MAG: DUF2125 domain-containing protein [Magnetovibrionaceae bacterium]